MYGSKDILFSAILSVTFFGAAMAAPSAPAGTPPSQVKPAPVPSQITTGADCQKLGGDISALIDTSVGSPKLPAARAAFQVGIMDCMEGDDIAANKHYQEAKKLLSSDRQDVPVSSPKS
jgi:hypothetical protein